jgi:phenylacetate-CoA ligase
VTGAEKLWSAQRERLEAVFAAPVHERYGSREIGFIAGQLEGAAGAPLAVDWANLLVEPETDDPESAVLITKLHADAMPMIRYRVDDVARFPDGSAPGHPAWELLEVIGRQLDGLWLPDGRWVHGVGIPHLMKEQPLHEYQIRQNADFTIDVLIVPNEQYSAAAGDEILRVLSQNLPGVSLHLQTVASIERTAANKWRPVVSHAAQAARPAGVEETA